jgi:hypothetical protein
MWKEVFVACFKFIYLHYLEGLGRTTKTLRTSEIRTYDIPNTKQE